ncbi:hypothetical protein A9Q94_00845 [Rhodobacterales bacterium 56_14_T64]|nr:hypothetical protein A9Q94_00845 [Rhodobacterales bacterium 56_14_T64]
MSELTAVPTVYFCHGLPGSPADANLISEGLLPGTRVVAPKLLEAGRDVDNILDETVTQFDKLIADARGYIHVIGFSIGAMVACKIAAERPEEVGRLSLISPAAPLQLGDFLPHMAGAPVFEMARDHPRRLAMATVAQGIAARLAPGLLIKALFAKCGSQEQALIEDPQVQFLLKRALENSYRKHPLQYRQMLTAYVGDWTEVLPSIQCPVDLWHGTADSWSPLAMSEALKIAIKAPTTLHEIKGGEHYSTLAKFCVDG